MPNLNTTVVAHRAAQLSEGRDALVVLAKTTGIPHGTLRNAVGGRQPLSLARCYTLAEALDLPIHEVLANNDGVPDLPPKQPKGPKAPPRRQDHEDEKKGPPKRLHDEAVA